MNWNKKPSMMSGQCKFLLLFGNTGGWFVSILGLCFLLIMMMSRVLSLLMGTLEGVAMNDPVNSDRLKESRSRCHFI